MPISQSLIDEINAIPEADRTAVQRALLDAAAEQNNTDGINWEQAFQHPRFKELNSRAKSAEDALEKLQREQRDAQTKALAEQNQYKPLYEQLRQENEELRNKGKRAMDLEAVIQQTLDAELSTIQPEMRKLVPTSLSVDEQLKWISTNRSLLSKQPARDIGNGKRNLGKSGGKKDAVLTADEKAIANAYGYSPEEYIKFRDGLKPVTDKWHVEVEDGSSGEEDSEQ